MALWLGSAAIAGASIALYTRSGLFSPGVGRALVVRCTGRVSGRNTVALPLHLSVPVDISPARNTSRQAKSVGASKIGGAGETEGKRAEFTAGCRRIRDSTTPPLAADTIMLCPGVCR